MESPLSTEAPSRLTEELAPVVAVQLRSAVMETWRELRALERQIDDMTEAFDGEDVLHPHVREQFDDAKRMLLDLHERLPKFTGPFELPEPEDDLQAMVSKIVERETER